MWELIFLMVIMKIPIVYLCAVVWRAVRAQPKPLDGAALVEDGPDAAPGRWPTRRTPRRPRGGPHGFPRRSYARSARVARSVPR